MEDQETKLEWVGQYMSSANIRPQIFNWLLIFFLLRKAISWFLSELSHILKNVLVSWLVTIAQLAWFGYITGLNAWILLDLLNLYSLFGENVYVNICFEQSEDENERSQKWKKIWDEKTSE